MWPVSIPFIPARKQQAVPVPRSTAYAGAVVIPPLQARRRPQSGRTPASTTRTPPSTPPGPSPARSPARRRARSSSGRASTGLRDPAGAQRSEHRRTPTRREPAGGAAPDYLVDGEGRRVGKAKNGVLVQQWVYHDGLRPAAELDGAGNVVARFVYADGGHAGPEALLVAALRLGERSVGARSILAGIEGGPLAYVVRDGTAYRVLSDQLGTPRRLLDPSNGNVVKDVAYDTWGNLLNGSGSDASPGIQDIGLAGGIVDADTGLFHFGKRDYDPFVGRWTAAERLWPSNSNAYRYAECDPANFDDPAGDKAPLCFPNCPPLPDVVQYGILCTPGTGDPRECELSSREVWETCATAENALDKTLRATTDFICESDWDRVNLDCLDANYERSKNCQKCGCFACP